MIELIMDTGDAGVVHVVLSPESPGYDPRLLPDTNRV